MAASVTDPNASAVTGLVRRRAIPTNVTSTDPAAIAITVAPLGIQYEPTAASSQNLGILPATNAARYGCTG